VLKGASVSAKRYRVVDPSGLHARPAARFVKAINLAGLSGTLRKGAREADLRSILEILGLGINCGDVIEIDLGDGEQLLPEDVGDVLEPLDAPDQ